MTSTGTRLDGKIAIAVPVIQSGGRGCAVVLTSVTGVQFRCVRGICSNHV